METAKKIIKSFEKSKLHDLEKCRGILTLGEPTLDCNISELIKDNDNRMKESACFIYYYQLLESNIINYKKYSSQKYYDEETLEMIEQNLIFNKKEYDKVIERIEKIRSGDNTK